MASSLERLQQVYPEPGRRAEFATEEPISVDVHWRSFELRPTDAPPISAEKRAAIESARPRVYAVAREQYGLEMNPGPFGFDSRPALVGAKFAEAQGVGPAYHRRVMNGYWAEARDIEQVETLAALAAEVGLARQAFVNALAEPAYERAVLADVAEAQQSGIHGVPALVFVDKYLVSGAQPFDVLKGAVEQVAGELLQEQASSFSGGGE